MKVIIVGGGQVGAYIAGLLLKSDCEVSVVENREIVLAKLKKDIPEECIVYGSGTEPTLLERLGIAQTDALIAVTGTDETNLVASTIAKFEFNVPRVIARVNNPRNSWLFNGGMGVDVAINQADLIARIAVDEIDYRDMLTLMKLNRGSYSIVEVKVDAHPAVIGHALRDLDIPKSAVLIAVYRGKTVIIPRGDTVFHAGDTVLAFADEEGQAGIHNIKVLGE